MNNGFAGDSGRHARSSVNTHRPSQRKVDPAYRGWFIARTHSAQVLVLHITSMDSESSHLFSTFPVGPAPFQWSTNPPRRVDRAMTQALMMSPSCLKHGESRARCSRFPSHRLPPDTESLAPSPSPPPLPPTHPEACDVPLSPAPCRLSLTCAPSAMGLQEQLRRDPSAFFGRYNLGCRHTGTTIAIDDSVL